MADRLVIEEMVGNFIKRSRERDFAFVAVHGLLPLFKVFVDQNLAAEAGAKRRAWPAAAAPVPEEQSYVERPLPANEANRHGRATGPDPTQLEGASADDLRSLLTRLLDKMETVQTPAEAKSSTVLEDLRLSEATSRYMESERKRRGSSKPDALLGPIFGFLVDFLGDKMLTEIESDDFARLDAALVEIPTNKGFALKERSSLHARYLRAHE